MEETIKVLGALATIVAAYKILVDVVLARSTKHREEYQFAKDYILDLESSKVHRFVLEKGFRALTGDTYSVEEIRHLLSYVEPTKAINCRASSDKIVMFDEISSCYEWSGIYRIKSFRKIAAPAYMALYIVFGFVAVFPLFFKNQNVFFGVSAIVFCVSTGVLAIMSLVKLIDFKKSELLMSLGIVALNESL